MNYFNKAAKRIRTFSSDTEGNSTMEFALWLPFMAMLLILTVDASLLFMTQSNYWSVSRDTARLVARHAMDENAAEAYAVARARTSGVTPLADVTINGATVTVQISAPARSIAAFNALGLTTSLQIDSSVTQSMEPI